MSQLPQLEGPIQEEFLPIEVLDDEDYKYEYSVYVTTMEMDKGTFELWIAPDAESDEKTSFKLVV